MVAVYTVCMLMLSLCRPGMYIPRLHYNNNIYLLQLGCNPVAVVILHVYKT